MAKYETNLDGYEPLKYSNEDKKMMTSDEYQIHITKISIINSKQRILKPSTNFGGYLSINVHSMKKQIHRLIWEHCRGLIPSDVEIDHIDDNPANNSIENLQLLTHQQNLLKSAKNRDYSFVKENRQNKRVIKVVDTNTGETNVCQSLYGASLFCGINAGIIKMCCEKTNHCTKGIS